MQKNPSTFDIDAIRTRTKEVLGDWPHMALERMPEWPATPEDIDKAGLFSGLNSRAAYLAWVGDYKALINEITAVSRNEKRLAQEDEDNSWKHQGNVRRLATAATALNLMRRHGKVWSAEQRAKALQPTVAEAVPA